ncbi:MAG: hypothetical protein RH946_00710 [Rhodospirillales bacterium]
MSEDRVTRVETTPFRKVSRFELPESVLTIPEGLNPLDEGIFMAHQTEWVADDSDLKLNEKGRRTGITWAEAQDDTLIAAASREAGGDNVFYIGDTKEKGLEFIGYCAHFTRFIEGNPVDIWEGETQVEYVADGQTIVERLASYTIRFKSGFRISALASRPAVIRGLQGVVVIDEAAFHQNVKGVIDACNALLIWGGRIRIISTHNGVLNAFNELVKECHEGKWNYSLHRVTFDDAVKNGLYERVCLVKGWTPTPEKKQAWYDRVRGSYGTRVEAMRQELDAIPLEGGGTMLPMAWIEACMTQDYKVVRWEAPDPNFVDWPESARRAEMEIWLRDNVDPLFALIPFNAWTAIGGDFAMRVDRSVFAIGFEAKNLALHIPFIVEMRGCPYDQQKQALYFIADRLQRLRQIVLDAQGNGMPLAQEARQRYGPDHVVELMAKNAWFMEWAPRFRELFESQMILIAADADHKTDLKQFQMSSNGVWRIPQNVRNEGTDGGKRHADFAIAAINLFSAIKADVIPIEFEAVGAGRPSMGAFIESPSHNTGDFSDAGFGVIRSDTEMGGF